MLIYQVKVQIVGSGNRCLKNKTKIPSVKWSYYFEGGYRPRFGDDCYSFKTPEIPHFLWWYYEKYHVEYSVSYIGQSFSWKRFLSLNHLHIEEGDIVIDENNNQKYVMVKNPITTIIDHHKVLAE